MFIGHFGAGFGAKSLAPRVSLGTLFIGAQFVDLIWPSLLLLGVERVRIVPGATVVTPLVFEHYPVSHSLLAVIGWATLLSALYLLHSRSRRGAMVVGALVLSHWLLDAIVHQPDLPLMPGSAISVGLGAWMSVPLTLLIEVPLFLCGVWLYARHTSATDAIGVWGFRGLVAFLLLMYAGNILGSPPPNPEAIAWVGHAQWLMVLWGFWIDRHRRPA